MGYTNKNSTSSNIGIDSIPVSSAMTTNVISASEIESVSTTKLKKCL
jgi:hypothetical protein